MLLSCYFTVANLFSEASSFNTVYSTGGWLNWSTLGNVTVMLLLLWQTRKLCVTLDVTVGNCEMSCLEKVFHVLLLLLFILHNVQTV